MDENRIIQKNKKSVIQKEDGNKRVSPSFSSHLKGSGNSNRRKESELDKTHSTDKKSNDLDRPETVVHELH